MKCPVCSKESRVLDSRKRIDGIHRRRSCDHCGERFSTIEKLITPKRVETEKMPSKPKTIKREANRSRREFNFDDMDEEYGVDTEALSSELGIYIDKDY